MGRRGRSPVPPSGDEGRMTLVEHLRELRSRLFKVVVAFVLAAIVGLIFYNDILEWFIGPFEQAVDELNRKRELDATINFDGIADPFTIPLKVALLTGVVLSSPVWIYQLWAFIVPGLYRNERRWALITVAATLPLFLSGIVLCYWLLPRGLAVILGFTPQDVTNIVSFSHYFSFVVRLELVFGLAFLLPIFVIMLNLVGVFAGRTLSRVRPWVIFGIFAFAAVATPTGDPITMIMLAVPMWILFEMAVVICRINDRRNAQKLAEIERMADGREIT
jgi:sec-independent protein translocase protein TatC